MMTQHPSGRALRAGHDYAKAIENQEAWDEMYLDSLAEDEDQWEEVDYLMDLEKDGEVEE